TVSARNIPIFRDPAIILIDQLKEIYVDGTLDPVETANWFPKVARKDYQIGQNNTGSGVDDPDQQFYENYACGSERNYTGYCNPELNLCDDVFISLRLRISGSARQLVEESETHAFLPRFSLGRSHVPIARRTRRVDRQQPRRTLS